MLNPRSRQTRVSGRPGRVAVVVVDGREVDARSGRGGRAVHGTVLRKPRPHDAQDGGDARQTTACQSLLERHDATPVAGGRFGERVQQQELAQDLRLRGNHGFRLSESNLKYCHF